MFKRTKVCSGLMLAFGGTLALNATPAFSQQQLERVEITGSFAASITSAAIFSRSCADIPFGPNSPMSPSTSKAGRWSS